MHFVKGNRGAPVVSNVEIIAILGEWQAIIRHYLSQENK